MFISIILLMISTDVKCLSVDGHVERSCPVVQRKACLQEKIFSVFENLLNLFHHISITQQNEKVT